MTSHSLRLHIATVTPPRLDQKRIDELLEMRLIAKLVSLDADSSIQVMPIWFRRDGDRIIMPTPRHTHMYRNLVARPHASVTVDLSRSGSDLRGDLIRGTMEIVEGDEARRLNRSIHLRSVTKDGLALQTVKAYLVEGDDITLRLSMDKVMSCNNGESPIRSCTSASRSIPAVLT